MADCFEPETRSRVMAAVKGRDTAPELAVRRAAHRLGYRFRLHGRLPGKPDLVFPGRRKVIFVHGCFWHRHEGCPRTTHPATRAEFWRHKFARNVERDRENLELLAADRWGVLTVWECETVPSRREELSAKLVDFLGERRPADRPRGVSP